MNGRPAAVTTGATHSANNAKIDTFFMSSSNATTKRFHATLDIWTVLLVSSLSVRAAISVSFLEFFARADRLYVGNAVEGQNPVQVINLVLQQFRIIAVVAGVKFVLPPFQILVANGDVPVPP